MNDQSRRFAEILRGLIDGSKPLPLPHPQRLNFPNDDLGIDLLAAITSSLVADCDLTDDDIPHLLFKLASWLTKVGNSHPDLLQQGIIDIWMPVRLAITGAPHWLRGRAGVSWTIRRFRAWQNSSIKLARESYQKPPHVRPVRLQAADDQAALFELVELTNASHVYQEGKALGHCMARSLNVEAVIKHGYSRSKRDTPLDCLTYAVKLRTGELRLFSLRNLKDVSLATASYNPKTRAVHVQTAADDSRRRWTMTKCAAVHAISQEVEVTSVTAFQGCDSDCPRRGWCRQLNFATDWGTCWRPEGPLR